MCKVNAVIRVMSHLHRADFCLNHAMAVNVGHSIPGTDGLTVKSVGRSTTWAKLLSFLEPPSVEERSVNSFYSHAVMDHATTISSVVRDGKRYVWYHNPWGYDDDVRNGGYDWREAPDQEAYDKADAAQIEDIRNNVLLSDKHMYECYKIKLHGERLIAMLKNLEKRGDEDYRRVESIAENFNAWRYPRGDRKREQLSAFHVMSILALLKFATDSDHLVPIHPSLSMKNFGPQQEDGVDEFLEEVTRVNGACVLWSKVYMQRVDEVMTELLKKRVSVVPEALLLDTIENTLTKIHLRDNPRLALVEYMDKCGGQKHWRTVLSVVYDMLPEFGESRPIRNARLVAGENLHFHSAWHVEALWKLDLVVRYLENVIERNYGSVENDVLKPECVAGFVEVIYIVSSAEARASPEYTELVGRIASYIVKGRLHKLYEVEHFIKIVKMLIHCKQESFEDEVGVQARQSYPLPAPTRADQDSARKFLHEHADTYGYGVSTNGFREDTRKKRRRLEN